MQLIHEHLLNSEYIHTALVPVIKLAIQVGNDTLHIDITEGSQAACESVSIIKSIVIRHPNLRPLVLIIKELLANKQLNKPWTGGLNSYSIVLMTATFLENTAEAELGQNLIDFLYTYGFSFDPAKTALDG